jgi:Putative peptidoglycan binding domain
MKHVVVEGDCLASLAAMYGFADGATIRDHADNAGLKALRPDWNLLYPGDVVTIPERTPKVLSLATGARHSIVVKRPKRLIRVKFVDSEGEPMKGPYKLTAGDTIVEGELDGDGILAAELPVNIVSAALEIDGTMRSLLIGHLNPLRDADDGGLTGVQARLSNLGYAPGAVDGDLGPKTLAALQAFQQAHGLEPTGELDDATLSALEKEHGH